MAKTVQEAKLSTRNSRLALGPRHQPYFRQIEGGAHLGYRRSTVRGRAGAWLARRYAGAGKYETEYLGIADDIPEVPADGVNVMTFDQAQAAARTWARASASTYRAATASAKSPSVGDAVVEYIAFRKERDPVAGRDAELRLNRHVAGAPLAAIKILALSEPSLMAWRKAVTRGGRSKGSLKPLAPATLARLLNDVRAALSAAARKARAPAEVTTAIREGLRSPRNPDRARPKQVLANAEVRRLVATSATIDPDFGALVMVLAATGTRFSQAIRINVADLQPELGRVMVPLSRKGSQSEKERTHVAVPLGADVITALKPLATSRAGNEPLLMRWHLVQVKGDRTAGILPRWERSHRRPWNDAAEMTRPWQSLLAAEGLPLELVPLCLRHSSIVRGLRALLPVRLVAEAHDTSVAMIEKHYGAFMVDASEDLLRRALLPLAEGQR